MQHILKKSPKSNFQEIHKSSWEGTACRYPVKDPRHRSSKLPLWFEPTTEFARVVAVDGTDVQFAFDAKNCLSSSMAGVPAGSKKLRVQRKQVGGVSRVFYLFGEYRSEQQCVDESLLLQHPFDQFCDVPDCVTVSGCFSLCWWRVH